jgi:hypothetical protein
MCLTEWIDSAHFLKQLNDSALLVSLQRSEGSHCNLMSAVDRLPCDPGPSFGQGDHAVPSVAGVNFDFNDTSRPKPVHNTLGCGGIKADKPAELILRSGADFCQFGYDSELGLR